LVAEGRFRDFSYVHIGNLLGNPVTSLCVRLDDVTFMPDGDLLPDEDSFFVPVLAIDSAIRTS
jgi:hypothetical protein